jgi:hypothetical protein
MLLILSRLLVGAAGVYLLTLGATSVLRPAQAKRYLEAHASTAALHFTELLIRLMAGAAFVVAAPHMRGAQLVRLGGWILVGTTLVLSIVPWRYHQRFAAWSVPMATRRMGAIAVGGIGGGTLLLLSLLLGP